MFRFTPEDQMRRINADEFKSESGHQNKKRTLLPKKQDPGCVFYQSQISLPEAS